MADDTDQSLIETYERLTISEAAIISEIGYHALYKAIQRGRLKATMFEPDHVPADVWNRLDAYAQANIAKQDGIWIIRRADLDEYLRNRRQGYRSDLL